ncbi:MAG: hypothetical protein ACYC6W_02840 [Nitrosotalea sp.]
MKTLQISIISILFIFIIANTDDVFADTSSPHLNVTMDKMYYNNTDTAHVLISGHNSLPVNLEVMDSSSFQQKIATGIQLDPTGTGTFSFNLTSFSYGIYTAKISQGDYSVKINFGVGITPAESGGVIILNLSKYDYTSSEIIQIHGWGHPNSMIRIDLIDPYSINENSTHITSNSSGHFWTEIGVPHNAVNGTWKILATDGIDNVGTDIKVISSNYGIKNENATHMYGPPGNVTTIQIESPLQQLRHGTDPKDVTCWQGLQLIFKFEDSSPACVTQQTAQTLVEQGWGMWVPAVKEQNIPVPPNSIKVTNTNFTINYGIAGNGTILDAKMDAQSTSLILSVNTTSNGTLTVSIPRALLDSKENNQDTQFIVLVDGQEVKYTETTSMIVRTLTIPFESGSEKIQIIATQRI